MRMLKSKPQLAFVWLSVFLMMFFLSLACADKQEIGGNPQLKGGIRSADDRVQEQNSSPSLGVLIEGESEELNGFLAEESVQKSLKLSGGSAGAGSRGGVMGRSLLRKTRPSQNDHAESPSPSPEMLRDEEAERSNENKAENKKREKTHQELASSLSRMLGAEQGELWAKPRIEGGEIVRPATLFPLKHTSLETSIAGYIATSRVTQAYTNPFEHAIEAIYVFPLPEDAAINAYRMKIGERTIVGMIMRREEAKATYEKARSMGFTASLLEQERPNIFTQSVANIAPKMDVEIEIQYFGRLKQERGNYEYHFPMVVGPRYSAHAEDSERIATQVIPEGMRNGHDISLKIDLDAGFPLENVEIPTHAVRKTELGSGKMRIELEASETIPNRDFVLRYSLLGAKLQTGIVSYAGEHAEGESDGFVSMMFAPPLEPDLVDISPREITFLIDTSGSMSGTPIELCKQIVFKALDQLRPQDAFNIFFFAGGNGQLWELPRSNTPENVAEAKAYLNALEAGGGTEMLAGLRRLFKSEGTLNRLRMVAFLTDGYIGSESEILAEVKKHADGFRFFAYGIGSSVNRYLLEGIGKHGRGHTSTVLPREYGNTDKAVNEFFSHIDAPILTDIRIDWGELPVSDQYPAQPRDLFAGHPISVIARYQAGAPLSGKVKIRARRGGLPIEYELPVTLSAPGTSDHQGLEALWARQKIAELMDQRLGTSGQEYKHFSEEIIETALRFQLVSEGTSFIAVDDYQRVGDGNPEKVVVPVEQPEDVSREFTRPGEGSTPKSPVPPPMPK